MVFLVLCLVGCIPLYCSNCFQLPSDSQPEPSCVSSSLAQSAPCGKRIKINQHMTPSYFAATFLAAFLIHGIRSSLHQLHQLRNRTGSSLYLSKLSNFPQESFVQVYSNFLQTVTDMGGLDPTSGITVFLGEKICQQFNIDHFFPQ